MKRAPITYETTPVTAAAPPAKPKVAKAARAGKPTPAAQESAGTEMLSARVSTPIIRQFRALVKLRGEKVQTVLETAISEYLERNRF